MNIYMYAFDRKGFPKRSSPLKIADDLELHFVGYKDERRLDTADGLIIPSGVFESFKTQPGAYSGPWVDVHCDETLLLTRFREVVNLIDKKKWVCCLIGQMVDEVPKGTTTATCSDTDLAKRVLNELGIHRFTMPSGVVADPKYDEFRKYLARWGVAKTVLYPPRQLKDCRTLATAGNQRIVGLEAVSQILALPFHTSTKDEAELLELGRVLVESVCSYLLKRSAQIPEWVDEFCFAQEKVERQHYVENLKALEASQAQLLRFRGYKGALVRSGDALRDTVKVILQEFFGLRCSVEDEGKEDTAILDEAGEVATVVEVKGTKRGVKREHVNQVDSHRERQGLPSTLPGVLVINDFMAVNDFDERRKKPVVADHVRRAHNSNVLVIRTTDLLLLMKHTETAVNRGEVLVQAIEAGGGILTIKDDGSLKVDPGPEK